MKKSVNSNGLLTPMPPWSTKDHSHKNHKKTKKKKLIDSTEKMNEQQNKNGQRAKSIYLEGNKNNCAKNNLEKLDEENENFDEKIENETGERNDGRIMNSVIVNSKNEQDGESEQIQNGGAKIILKDDGKTVNKNDYIDIPKTNNKEKSESKSGETKKKKRPKKKSINNEIHANYDEKEVKPNNTGHYDKITPVYDNVTAVYDNVTPVSID